MTTFAVSMVRDESDIVAFTVGNMAHAVDQVIVADNNSIDGTREILEDLDVLVVEDNEPGYFQAAKMTALADRARAQGADWVVPFDADELWLASGTETIAEVLAELPDEALIAEAGVLDHVAVPGYDLSPWRRAEQLPLRKVAVRAWPGIEIHQGNHGATFNGVTHPLTVTGQLEVRHFPYRSVDQMIRKARNGAAAYAATDLPEHVGKHWRDYGRLSDEQITEVFHTYFWEDDPEAAGLVYDPCPTLK